MSSPGSSPSAPKGIATTGGPPMGAVLGAFGRR